MFTDNQYLHFHISLEVKSINQSINLSLLSFPFFSSSLSTSISRMMTGLTGRCLNFKINSPNTVTSKKKHYCQVNMQSRNYFPPLPKTFFNAKTQIYLKTVTMIMMPLLRWWGSPKKPEGLYSNILCHGDHSQGSGQGQQKWNSAPEANFLTQGNAILLGFFGSWTGITDICFRSRHKRTGKLCLQSSLELSFLNAMRLIVQTCQCLCAT